MARADVRLEAGGKAFAELSPDRVLLFDTITEKRL